ncbi:MAG TPA: SRPBCC family protein [Pseudonocardiaceae bacterium]|nr:SRPBCC family protein [Pseudonocardiaceae bacterium]
MRLEHNFTVPAPVNTVWRALLEPERVAPCFPGATITSASDDEFAGIVKVRLGPISLQYRGSGRFTEIDEAAYRTVIETTGTAAGGQSTAAATVTATLAENGAGTAVTLATDLTITGKPAQFGRGMIEDVGGKIIGQFADCLSKSLAPQQEPAPPAPTSLSNSHHPASSTSTPQTEEIDLLDAAGSAVARRVITPLAVLLLLLALILMRRRRQPRP